MFTLRILGPRARVFVWSARGEDKASRLPNEVYSAILTIGGLRQGEKFWETIAHSPPDTSGHDSSECTEWFFDKSNCIASRRNVAKGYNAKRAAVDQWMLLLAPVAMYIRA
ncbi:hypothetical protein BOTNAR_0286g00020 [Botryotinia narcissicola]|uniref:Uncharacterized protein n=1 Tax=Botryotinia narcissicola TaxID=278944 RepID=A0A4Z1HXK2_9HELO|nr:hypothetical protein BOTNAR_0286g00020 [Botryotinia narcissicola]